MFSSIKFFKFAFLCYTVHVYQITKNTSLFLIKNCRTKRLKLKCIHVYSSSCSSCSATLKKVSYNGMFTCKILCWLGKYAKNYIWPHTCNKMYITKCESIIEYSAHVCDQCYIEHFRYSFIMFKICNLWKSTRNLTMLVCDLVMFACYSFVMSL